MIGVYAFNGRTKNNELATNLERQNGAKYSFCSQKQTDNKARKARNSG